MDGSLHYYVEQLAFFRFGIDLSVIPTFHSHNTFQNVRDGDIAPLVLVRKLENLT